jgi:hypothetical protein
MSFYVGLGSALIGAVSIGTGQTLQKLAVNRLGPVSLEQRIQSRLWLLGVLMTYGGECGNWLALSMVSASLVTPLGIVAVLVSVLLANRLLDEPVSANQRQGYAMISVGVVGILLVSPRAVVRHDTAASLHELVQSINFVSVSAVIATLLAFSVGLSVRSKRPRFESTSH